MIDYCKLNCRGKIFLMGKSFGAAVACFAATELSLEGGVPAQAYFKGLIMDSGFTSASAVLKYVTGGWIPSSLYSEVKWPTIDRISKVTIPLLILHGDQDDIVPISMAYELQAKAPHSKI
jgi:fermentation-respiration switch protein FrsA (DUF1100 family)